MPVLQFVDDVALLGDEERELQRLVNESGKVCVIEMKAEGECSEYYSTGTDVWEGREQRLYCATESSRDGEFGAIKCLGYSKQEWESGG